jgi:hypothetical protein
LVDRGGLRDVVASLNAIARQSVGVGEDTRSGKDRENEDESGKGVGEHLGFIKGGDCDGGCVDGRTELFSTGELTSTLVPFNTNSESRDCFRA